MKALTKETQAAITPDNAISLLREGNQRFQSNKEVERNLLAQVSDTSTGQCTHQSLGISGIHLRGDTYLRIRHWHTQQEISCKSLNQSGQDRTSLKTKKGTD